MARAPAREPRRAALQRRVAAGRGGEAGLAEGLGARRNRWGSYRLYRRRREGGDDKEEGVLDAAQEVIDDLLDEK